MLLQFCSTGDKMLQGSSRVKRVGLTCVRIQEPSLRCSRKRMSSLWGEMLGLDTSDIPLLEAAAVLRHNHYIQTHPLESRSHTMEIWPTQTSWGKWCTRICGTSTQTLILNFWSTCLQRNCKGSACVKYHLMRYSMLFVESCEGKHSRILFY